MMILLLLLLPYQSLGVVTKKGYKGWATYEVGKSTLILSAPHGGVDMPKELPLRHTGCYEGGKCVTERDCVPQPSKCRVTTVLDKFTYQITDLIARKLRENNLAPHVIKTNVSRKLIDLNRPIDIACLGVQECENLYNSYHGLIKEAIASNSGFGLFIEIHGQGHAANWTELGYRVTKTQLNSGNYNEVRSSIHHLQLRSGLTLKELFTGRHSMGHYLSENGYRVVPSGIIPKPDNGGYYRGGYNTQQYGSEIEGRCMDAIQFEIPKGLRFSSDEKRKKVAADFAFAIQAFYEVHNYDDRSIKCSSGMDVNAHVAFLFGAVIAVFWGLV